MENTERFKMTEKYEDYKATYEEFENLPEDVRAEYWDGVIVFLASPTFEHQEIQANLLGELVPYLKGKECQALGELDVKLGTKTLRPDLVILCDKNKKEKNRINGAPDLVIEIVSSSSVSRDNFLKLNLYKDSGVKEYWIISPTEQMITVYEFDNQEIASQQLYSKEENQKIPLKIFPDFEILMDDIFTE